MRLRSCRLLLRGGWFRTRRPGVKFGVSFFFPSHCSFCCYRKAARCYVVSCNDEFDTPFPAASPAHLLRRRAGVLALEEGHWEIEVLCVPSDKPYGCRLKRPKTLFCHGNHIPENSCRRRGRAFRPSRQTLQQDAKRSSGASVVSSGNRAGISRTDRRQL